jgi:hypothetical protein
MQPGPIRVQSQRLEHFGFVEPTHGECRAVAGAVRKAMKEKGLLLDSEHSVMRLQRLNLTESQQRDAVNYKPG